MRTVCDYKGMLAKFGGVLKSGSHKEGEGECCVLELESACRGIPLTDDPDTVGLPDFRAINDASSWSSDQARTDAMLPMLVAATGWSEWSVKRRVAVVSEVALEMVRRVIAELPGLPDANRTECRDAKDLAAASAARAASDAARAARAASYAASAAARAASYAASAAASAASAASYAARAASAASYAARAASYAARAASDAASDAASAARAASDAASDAASAASAASDAASDAGEKVLILCCQIWVDALERERGE